MQHIFTFNSLYLFLLTKPKTTYFIFGNVSTVVTWLMILIGSMKAVVN
jgi:hypothetical protein